MKDMKVLITVVMPLNQKKCFLKRVGELGLSVSVPRPPSVEG